MVQLILGTVQLGLDYGINNKSGKPNDDKSFEMLDYAYHNGISILDTASAYGDSEKIIGNYMDNTGNDFEVVTKLSQYDGSSDLLEFVNNQVTSSLNNLSKKSIDLYLIHSFNDLISNKNLIELLLNMKNEGMIKKLGVSLYEPSELEYIISDFSDSIEFVQIPFNLLDSRWLDNNLLKKANMNGIKIFVRSIFLQGLFFIEDEYEMNKIDNSVKKYVKYLNNVANKKNISMNRLAIDYVCSFKEIDGVLIGCETIEQLKENIEQFNSKNSINDEDIKHILEFTNGISEKIIDPRKW